MADNKPKKQPKKMTRRGFIACGATAAGLVGVTAAVNVGTNMFKSAIDHYIGGGETTITNAPGSENWDTAYYDKQYRGRGAATEDAKQIVVEIEGEGIVLLKNDNNALPLASGESVSLIGRFAADPVYGGAGSGTVDPNDCVTLHDGIAAAGLTINETAYGWIAENYGNYDKANITMDNPNTATYYIGEIPWADYSSEAQGSISGTTALVVIGRGGGEGGDLSQDLLGTMKDGKHAAFVENSETANYEEGQHELELSREERDLITAAKDACDKVIVLYNGSTPMELAPLMSGELEVDAIVAIGSLGASGATAVGQVLTGVTNPSGRTTDIWATDFTADPTFGNFGGKQYTDVTNYYAHNYNGSVEDATAYFVEYKEGIYYGYRYYETAAAEAEAGNYSGFDYDEAVLFPFGYGLSYTTFAYSDLRAAEKDVSFTITNTGKVAGAEVAQLYVSKPNHKVFRPEEELKGFAKVMLEPGESKVVTIKLDDKAFRYFNVKTNGWEVEGGTYELRVAASSDDVRLTASVEVSGTNAPNPYAGVDVTPYETASVASVDDAHFAALLGHPIPDGQTQVDRNVCFRDLNRGRSLIFWVVWLVLRTMKNAADRSGHPNLNVLFIWNMPLRAIAKMTNGIADMGVVDALVREVKGFGWGGIVLLVASIALGWGVGVGILLWVLWIAAPILFALVSNLVQNSGLAKKIDAASRAR